MQRPYGRVGLGGLGKQNRGLCCQMGKVGEDGRPRTGEEPVSHPDEGQ